VRLDALAVGLHDYGLTGSDFVEGTGGYAGDDGDGRGEAVMAERIPIAGPWITEKEIRYVTAAVRDGWYGNSAKYQAAFEQAFAAHAGRRFAVSLPSCTSGLHLSLAALGIGPGDEVIVPDLTWIATSAPVSYVGAVPVFADVDRDSWCITAASIEAVRTPRTKAVITVDLYGNMPDYAPIETLCREHNIALIEDAAEAAGATYRGRPAGAFGAFSAFSFHGSKTLTTGEGGILLLDDEAAYRCCLTLRDHGRAPGDVMFWNAQVAFKYRMSSMQAALGSAQLERLPELIERKREIFGWYREALGDREGIVLNSEAAEVRNVYWMVTAILDAGLGWGKEALMGALRQDGIDTRPIFYPLSMQPAYADFPTAAPARARNKVAYALSPYGINLPSALSLTRDQVDTVANRIKQIVFHREPQAAAAR
jgi:perosamine synthetase